MAKITVLGSGGFGCSLAVMLNKYGNEVKLWGKFQEELDIILKNGEHKTLLPGIPIDPSIELSSDISIVSDAELVIFAVPSFAVRSTAVAVKDAVNKDAIIANVAKGIDEESLKRLSEVISEVLPDNSVVALSGPSHAEEIARGVPTTIVASSKVRASADKVQDILTNTNLRVYVNDDTLGVEFGGAFKNIIAVCAGICDGMELGDNTKAALMTRGLAEISRLGVKMGGDPSTFMGLSGMGDLIVTCTSMHSRNRRCGIFIGQGLSASEAIERVGMTVEGCSAAKAAKRLSEKYGIEMPITDQLCNILDSKTDAKTALANLMDRPKRHENEHIWLNNK